MLKHQPSVIVSKNAEIMMSGRFYETRLIIMYCDRLQTLKRLRLISPASTLRVTAKSLSIQLHTLRFQCMQSHLDYERETHVRCLLIDLASECKLAKQNARHKSKNKLPLRDVELLTRNLLIKQLN